MRGLKRLSSLVVSTAALSTIAASAAPVPKAKCGPKDRVETSLQGQTSVAERQSGASEQAYNCNLELVGQYQGEGANWQLAWYNECAYVGTANRTEQQHRGVVVLDASDSRNPKATAYLDTMAMLNPWESLKVNEARKLLAGVQQNGPANAFATYDISGDCRSPVLKGDVTLPDATGHAGNWAPDGRTYYGGISVGGTTRPFFAVDTSNPSQPSEILGWTPPEAVGRPHDLSISDDGNRAYLAKRGLGPNTTPNGLVILNTSDIQSRKTNPQVTVVGTLFWPGGANAQQTLPVTFNGKPHLIFTDENGGGGNAGRTVACNLGLPPHGYARILDISAEASPKIVSELQLEVSDPTNCAAVINDPNLGLGYSSHYCGVDRTRDPTILACSYFEAGLRVFDIKDPAQPKEIAYYKPPAQRKKLLPGSNLWSATADRMTDGMATQVRVRADRNEIWFVSQDNGFQIVKMTNGVGLAAGGGGCSSVGGSFASFSALGVLMLLRRRRPRH